MSKTGRKPTRTIFVVVQGGVAEVDARTVPEGVAVEIVDLDDLAVDPSAPAKLSRAARIYAKRRGYL